MANLAPELCRICMRSDAKLISIFNTTTEKCMKTLAEMLIECIRYKVGKEDKLPKNICETCAIQVQDAYALKVKAELSFRQLYSLYSQKENELAENEIEADNALEKSTQTDVHSFQNDDLKNKPQNELNDIKHNCQLCEKSFSILPELRRHMLKEHTNSQPLLQLPCPICERNFSRKDHLRRHLIKVHKDDPNKYLSKLREMKVEESFECPICMRVFGRKSHFKRHIALVHKQDVNNVLPQYSEETRINVVDQECEVAVLNAAVWNDDKHFLDKNPFASDSESENQTDFANVSEKSSSLLIKQEPCDDFQKSKEEKPEKMVVKVEFPSFADDNDDGEDEDEDRNGLAMPDFHEEDNESDDSEEKVTEKKTEEITNTNLSTIFAEEGKPIKKKRAPRGDGTPEERTCILCQRIFSRLCHLRRHMQSAHTQQKPHSCPHCDKCFSRSDHLKNHIQGVHAEKTYKCDMCDKCFSRSEALQRHKEARHGDASGTYKIHECEFCGRKFTGKRYLARHRLLHTDRIYACRFCEETFKDRKLFREHERGHKTIERNFLCSICGDSFVRNDYLRIHMRRHLGEKPYKCQFCGKGFPRATDLKVHERYHTNTKPSVCQVCGKAFHRAYNLTIHMRIHTGEKPYKCEHCSKCFAQSNDLKAHVRRHTGERYKCEQCDASFLQLYGLRQHALSAHGTLIESSTGRLQKVGSLGSTNNVGFPTADASNQTNNLVLNQLPQQKPAELLNLSGNDNNIQHHAASLPLQPTEIQQVPMPPPMALIYPNVSAVDLFKAQQFMQLK